MKRLKFVLGGLVILAGLGYLLATGVQQSAATQTTLERLLANAGQGQNHARMARLQLGGSRVVPGSIQWDEYRSRPEFTITDGQRSLRVRYTGHSVLPDTFKDGALVVLEGQYQPASAVFDAEVVYAKCPSKYEGQSYDGHVGASGQG